MKTFPAYLLVLTLAFPFALAAETALSSFDKLKKTGLLAVGVDGRQAVSVRADKPLIPASTAKLATAWLALSRWGGNHRFRTEFYLDENARTLWIRGGGDPYLVSEELARIAANLKRLDLRRIDAIGLDTTLFAPDPALPGTGKTDNPYDAVP
ncbi:MAG: D-alanyl-D-alanine carboxypeptidase, partial [Gammaproteobacteria bacterium]